MKYIKANPQYNHIKVIVGEMINIMHGSNYFINGVLQSKPKKTNVYVIKSVEYTIQPNMGVVYITGPINLTLDMFKSAMTSMLVESKLDSGISINVFGSTQYISITQDVRFNYSMELCMDTNIFNIMNKDYANSVFKWFIYDINNSCSPLYIPNLTDIPYSEKFQQYLILLSLSSIIYDCINVYNIPHNTLMCDYPSIDLYANKSSICSNIITISLRSNIDVEIAKHFTTLDKKILHWLINSPIYWLKWDGDVKNANFDHIVNNDCNYLQTYISSDYRCILTNVKIYDDCYIFDIYQQEITELIPSKDLPAALAAGAQKSQIPTKKLVSKKGAANMVSITRIINYDKPIRFLVSGYAMHYKLYNNKTDAINWFQTKTNSKVIVYRTKCPVTREFVIKSLDKSKTYIDALLALNARPKMNPTTFTSTYNGKTYTFLQQLSITDVIQASSRDNYCKFQISN